MLRMLTAVSLAGVATVAALHVSLRRQVDALRAELALARIEGVCRSKDGNRHQ
ncbi:hypothetical protein [Streptomyces sp. NRRL F-5135]|uniref:hypothetical protein n=1 Tax=Streptomyces sp. NRRL F-5135 TaxID=1463858 RepID=UPI00131D9F45|nr:hypothetical protein [Streptomyces sp. NRRL F-5135]